MSEAKAPSVLVTGASRGLGRALAVEFAARGARVTGSGRDESALAETAAACRPLPGSFAAHRLDVRDEGGIEALVEAVGPIDVCVANAGIAEVRPFLDTDEEDLRRLLEVNVVGAFAVLRHAARAMLQRGEGRVVAIASDAALQGIPGMAAYVASKHALLGLTRTLALELVGTGVGVTTICPGAVCTEILGPLTTEEGMSAAEVAAAIAAIAMVGPTIGACELHLQPAEGRR